MSCPEKFSQHRGPAEIACSPDRIPRESLPSQDLTFQYRQWFTMGVLEVSIIHQFRNLFMSMMGNLSFVQEEIKQGRSPERYLKDLETGLDHASDMIHRIQTFEPRQKAALWPSDLNELIVECLDTLRMDSCYPILIQTQLAPALPKVEIDPLLLKLALWELLHQYRLTHHSSLKKENRPEPASAHIHFQTGTTMTSVGKPQVELLISTFELHLTTSTGTPLPDGAGHAFCENPALEILKSTLRLFHGEMAYMTQNSHSESIRLTFPGGRS